MAVGFVPDGGHKASWLRSGRRPQGQLACSEKGPFCDRVSTRRSPGGTCSERSYLAVCVLAHIFMGSGEWAAIHDCSFRTAATRPVGFVPDDGQKASWLRSGRRPSRFGDEPLQPPASSGTGSVLGGGLIWRRQRATRPGSSCHSAPSLSRKLDGPVPLGRSPSRFPEIDIEDGRLDPAPRNLP